MTAPADFIALPFVTVVVRSYQRLPHMIELVKRCQQQNYPRFEILVIEQSPDQRDAFRTEIDALLQDPRVKVLEFPALGPAQARNVATEHARGEVLLFIDDDDLPHSDDWVTCHARNYSDPLCVAVSGRTTSNAEEDPTAYDSWWTHHRCLRYTFLKMPRSHARHSTRLVGVTVVQGGNASLRKEAIVRAGGWDDEQDHDEDSFAFKFQRVKRPGEYFAYDPKPVMIRRLHVPGGLARRFSDVQRTLQAELNFSHRVVRRYFPGRFLAFYPCYLWLAAARTYALARSGSSNQAPMAIVVAIVRGFASAVSRAAHAQLQRQQAP